MREVVAESGQDPAEFALHSLRIGGASCLAAGSGVSDRVIQRKGRWKSDAYKVYTRSNIKDCELGLVYYLGRAVILRENRDKERCGTMNKQPLGLA